MLKPHIRLEKDKRFQRVITCGDPERASWIASFLEHPRELSKNREYHSYLGKFRDQSILIVSHGVGSAGAAICFNELIDVGAKTIIRIGTAGGLQRYSKIGDLVVASAAVRKDGVSSQMIPLAYPAIPDGILTNHLATELFSNWRHVQQGVVLTTDLFYPALLDPEWSLYKKAGVAAIEMECSALFVVSSLRGIRAAAILALDGNPLKGDYNPNSKQIKLALRAAVKASLDVLTGEDN